MEGESSYFEATLVLGGCSEGYPVRIELELELEEAVFTCSSIFHSCVHHVNTLSQGSQYFRHQGFRDDSLLGVLDEVTEHHSHLLQGSEQPVEAYVRVILDKFGSLSKVAPCSIDSLPENKGAGSEVSCRKVKSR